jgi:predicted amidohydrolase YtcJ
LNNQISRSDACILHNARVVDFAAEKSQSCTLLVEHGIIKERTTTCASFPKGVKKFNLQNKYVIPGFIDAHTHLISEGIKMQRLDLCRCRSLKQCFERIRADLEKRDISFASNWDETAWRTYDPQSLNRRTLDRLSRKKPIIMRRICGHYAVVNTAALRHIPETRKIIDRKRGALYEDAALNLNEFFPPTDEMIEKAVGIAMNKALRHGITSVHEISKPVYFRVLQKKKDALKIRFSVYLTEKYHGHVLGTGLRSGSGDDWLRFGGTKIFLDGSIGAYTAALRRPYRDKPERGKILVPFHRLKWFVDTAEANGIQLMLHSIGDRTIDTILRVLKECSARGNPLRHRLEHLELINRESITDMGHMKIIASMQPNFVYRWQKPGGFYERVLGSRFKKMNPFRSLLRKGVKVVFGSDCMPLGPLYGIQGVIAHPAEEERLNMAKAFFLYTEAGAFATFEEKKKGKIKPGYFADLVVLNKNPLEKKNLVNMKIEGVMVGGKLVYGNFPERSAQR